MERIDTLPVKDITKRMYKSALKKHLLGVNLYDIEAVKKAIGSLSFSVQCVCLNAVCHITAPDNEDVLKERSRVYQMDLSQNLNKPLPKLSKSMDALIKEAKERPQTQENHSLVVLLYLMKHHPRRFLDYYLLSTKKSEDKNVIDLTNQQITFNVFKNAGAITCGQRVVNLHEEAHHALMTYINKWKIDGDIFTSNKRRLRYLMTKYQIPLCNENRKIQETDAIRSGEDHHTVADRFNHSISTQLLSYLKNEA